MRLEYHDLCKLFPFSPLDVKVIQEDIAANGLRNPIVLLDGKILDGRNRYLACTNLGIEPLTIQFEGDEKEALAFVVSENLARRHLNESQRALVATNIATRKQGERVFTEVPIDLTAEDQAKIKAKEESARLLDEAEAKAKELAEKAKELQEAAKPSNVHTTAEQTPEEKKAAKEAAKAVAAVAKAEADAAKEAAKAAKAAAKEAEKAANKIKTTRSVPEKEATKLTQAEAAEQLNVGERMVRMARAVKDSGVPELVAKVEDGTLPVTVATRIAKLSVEEQTKVLQSEDPTKALKQYERADKVASLVPSIKEELDKATEKYAVLYADPPWHFAVRNEATGSGKSPDYPTMETAEIEALEVPAADNCILFLWATGPMLPDALDVMESWGFEYKSIVTWVKHDLGTGFWVRSRTEFLLIGTKGSVPAPVPGEQPDSIIEDAPEEKRHSSKPKAARTMIEKMFPGVPKLELFARVRHDGWTALGNDLPDATAPEVKAAE